MFGATIAIPLIVAPALCIGDDSVAKSEILGTLLFVSGLVTIIQTTVGIRLVWAYIRRCNNLTKKIHFLF